MPLLNAPGRDEPDAIVSHEWQVVNGYINSIRYAPLSVLRIFVNFWRLLLRVVLCFVVASPELDVLHLQSCVRTYFELSQLDDYRALRRDRPEHPRIN
jgi:hypothetical protein